MTHIGIIILTFNSEKVIQRTIAAAKKISRDIWIVDSFSADATLQICEREKCEIVQRKFLHYADQRNWAIAQIQGKYDWQLHLDSDETLDDAAIDNIRALELARTPLNGFLLRRRTVFWGKPLRHGGVDTWHMRLFRDGCGRVEDRLYDQHFLCAGETAKLAGVLLDYQDQSLSEWTGRHNRWSDLEAQEVARSTNARDVVRPTLQGNAIEAKRFAKGKYYQAPKYVRAMGFFVFRYVLLLGFLDGREGFVYHVLQGLWFRVLVDAKIEEAARERAADRGSK